MKKIKLVCMVAFSAILVLSMNACKPTDADVKAAIEKA